jgi:acetolactate synthase-1/2/3 large subunit
MTTVADVIIDGLARAGTRRLFAGPGAASLFIEAAHRRGLDVVPARAETAACVMAAVTGSIVGAPGAVVIAGDPTAAHDGLASAFLGRSPLIVLTTGGVDAPRAERPQSPTAITKAALQVGPGSAAHWIAHACQLAMTEPWGPVHLDVANDVARAAAVPLATSCRPAPLAPPDRGALDAAARLLGGAARPLLVVGLQCRSESDAAWLRAFAEALPAPALVTPKAKGALPDPHPLVIGTFGANARESELVNHADLIVAVGLDPLEVRPRAWPAETPVVHLAAAAPQVSDDYRVTATVVGEIGLILEELAPRLRERRLADWDVARLHALKQAMSSPPVDPQGLATFRLVETARQLAPTGAIAVFGATTAALARAWPAVAPGECLVPTEPALGGFTLPAAIAAQLARPGRRVICFSAAYELRAAVAELATATDVGCPVVVVTFSEVSARALATAAPAGWTHVVVRAAGEFAAALAQALGRATPVLAEVGVVEKEA